MDAFLFAFGLFGLAFPVIGPILGLLVVFWVCQKIERAEARRN